MVTWGANTVSTFATTNPAAGTPPRPGAAVPAPTFGFGAPAAGAGAPAAGGGLFGAATPQPPGTPAKAPSPAAGGLFGGASASAPAAGGLFGGASPAPAPAAGGLFGGASAPAPAAGGLFGGASPAPAPAAGGLFGTVAVAPAQAAAMAHITASNKQEADRLEGALLALHSAYSPTPTPAPAAGIAATAAPPSQCRFQHVFYDPMTPEQRQQRLVNAPHHPPPRPPHVDARTWADAVARNPDPLEYAPVVAVGAEALAARLSAQHQRSGTLAGYCTRLREDLSYMEVQSAKSADAARAARAEHEQLRSRLLGLMRRVEILRCTNLPLQPDEKVAAERARRVHLGVDVVGRALAEVEERGRHQIHALRTMGERGGGMGVGASGAGGANADVGRVELSDEARADLNRILTEQKAGLDALSSIVKRDLRDAKIVKEGLRGGGRGMSYGLGGYGSGRGGSGGAGMASVPGQPPHILPGAYLAF